jgi:hypothetical protein
MVDAKSMHAAFNSESLSDITSQYSFTQTQTLTHTASLVNQSSDHNISLSLRALEEISKEINKLLYRGSTLSTSITPSPNSHRKRPNSTLLFPSFPSRTIHIKPLTTPFSYTRVQSIPIQPAPPPAQPLVRSFVPSLPQRSEFAHSLVTQSSHCRPIPYKNNKMGYF